MTTQHYEPDDTHLVVGARREQINISDRPGVPVLMDGPIYLLLGNGDEIEWPADKYPEIPRLVRYIGDDTWAPVNHEQFFPPAYQSTYSITLATDDFRGDHAADVRISIEAREKETVEDLIKRVKTSRWGFHNADVIEIRTLHSTDQSEAPF